MARPYRLSPTPIRLENSKPKSPAMTNQRVVLVVDPGWSSVAPIGHD